MDIFTIDEYGAFDCLMTFDLQARKVSATQDDLLPDLARRHEAWANNEGCIVDTETC